MPEENVVQNTWWHKQAFKKAMVKEIEIKFCTIEIKVSMEIKEESKGRGDMK